MIKLIKKKIYLVKKVIKAAKAAVATSVSADKAKASN